MGLSKGASGFPFKPQDHSSVVEAFVDALELHDIRLLVYKLDWSGPIGLGLAERRPDFIHSLAITDMLGLAGAGLSPARVLLAPCRQFSRTDRFLIKRFNPLARYRIPRPFISREPSPAERRCY